MVPRAKKSDEADGTPVQVDPLARAEQVGLLDALVHRASEDLEWRGRVEESLRDKRRLGRLLLGGAKPADLWRHDSLLRHQFVRILTTDSPLFRLFALTNPRVETVKSSQGDTPADVLEELDVFERVLGTFVLSSSDHSMYEEAIAAACEALEAERAEHPDHADETADDFGTSGTPSADHEEVERLSGELKTLKAALAAKEKDLKTTKAELKSRTEEVRRKDRKATELRSGLREAQARADEAEHAENAMRVERDDCRREVARLQALVDSSKAGQRTLEQRRVEESERLQNTIRDLRERLGATLDAQSAIEKRMASLEVELADERERRISLEETFEAFGLGDLAGSACSLDSTLETLSRFLNGIVAYSAAQAEKEHARRLVQEKAEREREEAAEALLRQMQMEEAWVARERSRLEERERALFSHGPVDTIIIDGHNLILRVLQPEEEALTRQWLERIALSIAERFEKCGWSSRMHLVFDTPHPSNSRGEGHGLEIHYHNNVREGGADAKIRMLLEEGSPTARYMVVSTDRKHVWRDALELMRSTGREIDLVQSELFAQYVDAFAEFGD